MSKFKKSPDAATGTTTATITNETANALLTAVFNKLTERYLDTTYLPNPDVWGEEAQLIREEEELSYKMVQISSETDDNIYLVSQLRYIIDTGEMEFLTIFDGYELDCYQLDLSEGIPVDDIVSVMIEFLENVYEQYELYCCWIEEIDMFNE